MFVRFLHALGMCSPWTKWRTGQEKQTSHDEKQVVDVATVNVVSRFNVHDRDRPRCNFLASPTMTKWFHRVESPLVAQLCEILARPCAMNRPVFSHLCNFYPRLNRQEKTTISMDRIVWDRLLLIEVRCCNICLQCFECNEKIKNEDKSNERCKLMKIFNIMFLKLI